MLINLVYRKANSSDRKRNEENFIIIVKPKKKFVCTKKMLKRK